MRGREPSRCTLIEWCQEENTMRWKTIAIACIGLAALSVSAQVHRCKDAAGKTFYSDRPCDAGQTGQLIERPRTQDEIARERQQAAEANDRKEERRAAEQGLPPLQAPRPVAGAQPLQQAEGWQERKNRENAATSASSITRNGGRFDERAEAERKEEARRKAQMAPPPPMVPPTNITRCDQGFCYDNQGGVYHRNGDNFMTGPNGKACHRAGNFWNCS